MGQDVSAFHEIAALRGDGLHPLLLQALGRTGQVSGPPKPSEQTGENVIRPDFAARQPRRAAPKAQPR
ncbi:MULTISPECIES: hypothetical protein [unclassified Roseibium]|uniref:hypothetical protein n=1 Tax=unclassified Roseibium TaxID=2629323 RepID=UPI0031750A9C